MTALALFNLLKPDYARQSRYRSPTRISARSIFIIPLLTVTAKCGLTVTPTKIADKAPAVVVVHENRGLNPYIEDVARRVAKAGYIALAPDGLSAVGGYPGNDDEGRAQQKVDPVKLMNDFCGGRVYGELSTGDGKVGITGFATAAASATRRRWRSRSWPARCRFTVASRR